VTDFLHSNISKVPSIHHLSPTIDSCPTDQFTSMPRQKSSAMASGKSFPAPCLPPEVRSQMWRFAIVKDEGVIVRHHERPSTLPISRLSSEMQIKSHQQNDDRFLSSILAVALSCRQLYLKVTPIYHVENTFRVPSDGQGEISSSRRDELIKSTLQKFKLAIEASNTANNRTNHYQPPPFLRHYNSLHPGLRRLESNEPVQAFYYF